MILQVHRGVISLLAGVFSKVVLCYSENTGKTHKFVLLYDVTPSSQNKPPQLESLKEEAVTSRDQWQQGRRWVYWFHVQTKHM